MCNVRHGPVEKFQIILARSHRTISQSQLGIWLFRLHLLPFSIKTRTIIGPPAKRLLKGVSPVGVIMSA